MDLKRLETGISSLDEDTTSLDGLLGGGIPKGNIVVISGGPGAGKTILALQFAQHEAFIGEKSLYFTLEQTKEDVIEQAQLFGWNLPALEHQGNLLLTSVDISAINPAVLQKELLKLIDEQKPDEKKGVIYTWGGIGHLFEKEMVDIDFDSRFDAEGIDKALEFIKNEKPIFTFIHLGEPDGIGHNIGHDTPRYYKAIEEIDAQVGRFIDSLEKENILDDCIIIFSSDHGGIDKGHGGKTLLEVEIPWIVYGKNIVPQGEITSPVITYDTGATIAWLLGLERPGFWRGVPIMEIIEEK